MHRATVGFSGDRGLALETAQTIAAKLEAVFGGIRDTRMAGLPVLNEAMPVKAVGFREWGGYWLGVLITPWFMNLMLLPREAGAPVSRPGEAETHVLPAGRFAFTHGEEEGLGRYQMCSLFSPMFQFEEAEAAIATAEAVMTALFETGVAADLTAEERELQAMLTGKPVAAPEERKPDQPAPPEPLSRRALITGFQSGSGRDAG